MKIVCGECGAVTQARAEVENGEVRLICGACGHANRVGDDSGGAEEAPRGPIGATEAEPPDGGEEGEGLPEVSPELPPVKCPKCGHRQYDDDHCARCGLVFARVREGHRPWEDFPPEKMPHVEQARALWAAVEGARSDSHRHVTFVEHCRKHDLLGFAAMRYRHHLADWPGDAVAQEYLSRVVRDAQARVQIHKEPEDFTRTAEKIRNVLLVVVFVFCVVATVFILRVMRMQSGGL